LNGCELTDFFRARLDGHRDGFPAAFAVGLPDFPGSLAAVVQVIQDLLILKSVHGSKEPVVGVGDQLFLPNQTLKGLLYEFLAVAHVLETFLAKDKVSAVDAHAGARYLANFLDSSIRIRRDDMVA